MCKLFSFQFHGDTVFCISVNDQPYVPVKPIVENMGMDWGSQHTKLKANKNRWSTIVIMTTVAQDGKEREMLCIPLQKLPAYFASINPNKVRPGLRQKIELYQAECDNALWDYWTKGRAERKPTSEQQPASISQAELPPAQIPLSESPITPDQQCTIHAIVRAKAEDSQLPDFQGVCRQIWISFNNHFRLSSYKQLPQSRMSEAVAYLTQLQVAPKIPSQPARETLVSNSEEFASAIRWINDLLTRLNPVIEHIDDPTASFNMVIGLDVYKPSLSLTVNEQLLLQAIHDYTDMVFRGMATMVSGIKAIRRIKQANGF